LGLIALVIVLYAGFMWMTSGGNEEKISKAKKILSAGVIGLLIILASYAITSFILQVAQGGGGGGGGHGDYTEGLGGFGGGALGGGVIEYHYPARDATNIPRNTLIMISFKVRVATSSVIAESFTDNPGLGLCNNYTENNTNGNECGILSSDIEIIDYGSENIPLDPEDVVAVLTADGKNILLRPIEYLGNGENSTDTIVYLGAGMVTADGKDLFGGLENGYAWQFEVSTFLDLTPPTVSFVWPGQDQIVARNAIIQVNFSEPINILSVDGNIIVTNLPDEILAGELKISNQYKTIEFLAAGDCGGARVNSCGEEIFCLPALANIETLVEAGEADDPLSGISDAAGNLLAEDYIWDFNTTNNVYTISPIIESTGPVNNEENVQLNPNIWALFDLTDVNISPSSLNTDSFYIYDADSCVDLGQDDPDLEAGHKENIAGDNCFPAYSVYMSDDNKKCNIQIYNALENNILYYPRITSEIKDSYGNCFNPAEGPGGSER